MSSYHPTLLTCSDYIEERERQKRGKDRKREREKERDRKRKRKKERKKEEKEQERERRADLLNGVERLSHTDWPRKARDGGGIIVSLLL